MFILSLLSLGLLTAGNGQSGQLLLLGGGKKPREIMAQFVELAGGKQAHILIVPTASELEDTAAVNLALFQQEHGCTKVESLLVFNREDADSPEMVEKVKNANAIFFTGGDQNRITRAFLGSQCLDLMRNRFKNEGLVVAGTSAGTACMSEWMITGEGRFDRLVAGSVELKPGLGLVPGAILDQHFVVRSRQTRLICAILDHPELLGIGIDEATACWFKPDHSFEVLGEGWVQVWQVQPSQITRQSRGNEVALGAFGMVVHTLLPGQSYDMASRKPQPVRP
jgi:cyanophycinase